MVLKSSKNQIITYITIGIALSVFFGYIFRFMYWIYFIPIPLLMNNLVQSCKLYKITLMKQQCNIVFHTRFFFNNKYTFTLKDIESFHYYSDGNGDILAILFNNCKKNIYINIEKKSLQQFADYVKQYNIPTYYHLLYTETLL